MLSFTQGAIGGVGSRSLVSSTPPAQSLNVTRAPAPVVRPTFPTRVGIPIISPGVGTKIPTPVAAPVRTPLRMPTDIPVRPVSGLPSRGTAIVSPGSAGSVTLSPQGGSGVLSSQPAGPPPSGAPPSVSMVTNTGGATSPPDYLSVLSSPVQIGSSSIPMGWIVLAGVAVLIFFLAKKEA